MPRAADEPLPLELDEEPPPDRAPELDPPLELPPPTPLPMASAAGAPQSAEPSASSAMTRFKLLPSASRRRS